MRKQEVLAILDQRPDPLDPEQRMYELYVKAKIDRAEAAIVRGEVMSQQEVERRSQGWFE
jgi:hypothetical protein